MTGPAEGPVGPRRASVGEVLLLVAALIVTPRLFVIAPLAGLLAAARPQSGRSAFFAGLAFVLAAFGVYASSGLLDQIISAWTVITAGVFAWLSWRGTLPSLAGRALLSVAVGALATMIFAGLHGVSWAGLEFYAARELAAAFTAFAQASGGDLQSQEALAPLQRQVPVIAALLPAQLALGQTLGLVLAWRWHEWTTEQPLGPTSPPFATFRFGHGWVWLLIVPLAALLFGADGMLWSIAANMLVIMAGLYAVRGAAVVRALMPPVGVIAGALYLVAAAVLLVFVLGALTALGLVDNWYDFRRPSPGSSSRDQTPWK